LNLSFSFLRNLFNAMLLSTGLLWWAALVFSRDFYQVIELSSIEFDLCAMMSRLLVRVYDSMISNNSVSSEKLQCYTQNCYRSISNTIFVSGVDSAWSVYSLAALATVCCS
jgi:hypothetical protein